MKFHSMCQYDKYHMILHTEHIKGILQLIRWYINKRPLHRCICACHEISRDMCPILLQSLNQFEQNHVSIEFIQREKKWFVKYYSLFSLHSLDQAMVFLCRILSKTKTPFASDREIAFSIAITTMLFYDDQLSTHLLVPHICVSESVQYWFI